jgi:peptidoglycan/LPS O-acetylase OafA/YrhL
MKSPPKTAAERQDRNQWKILGGLRFLLAFIVVCGHLFRFAPKDNAINRVFIHGADFDATVAVFGFLIISGFSIAHSIISKPEGFYFRRVVRIYPLYISALVLTLVPFWVAGPVIQAYDGQFNQPGFASLIANLFFLQTFFAEQLSGNGPLWTLAVEVFFYLLAPLFVRMKSWMLLLLVLISAVGFASCHALHLEFYSKYRWGLPAFLLLWAWLGGFLFYRHREEPLFQVGLITLGVFLFSVNFTWNHRFTFFTYVFAASIVATASKIKLPAQILRLLNYLGELSYPLYLVHVPVLLFSYAVLGVRSAPIMVLLTLVVTAFVYHAIDRPIRLWMRSVNWLRRPQAGPFVPLEPASTR